MLGLGFLGPGGAGILVGLNLVFFSFFTTLVLTAAQLCSPDPRGYRSQKKTGETFKNVSIAKKRRRNERRGWEYVENVAAQKRAQT
ncbi:hypothetical protein F5Y11DRAFT_70205 [Daldinia sp. FL1419]|nr:hypothetical protein F5Y11DRAFT_70205 [Daldinia sp. FL1419]